MNSDCPNLAQPSEESYLLSPLQEGMLYHHLSATTWHGGARLRCAGITPD
jgi:hypothetical protein